MANFEIESRENWGELHRLIDEYFTHYNGYIFRGQADAAWSLESSLTRAIRKNYPATTDIGEIVKNHRYAFRENIRGRSSLHLDHATDDELWALGQHFGLYTPLLDWSRSPYVALFFSLFGEAGSGRRALWALLESDIQSLWPRKVKNKHLRIVRPLSHDNPRLVSQNGLFLDVPVGESADALVIKAKPTEYVTLYKIDFPDSIRNDVIAALNNMNINHASLFQDVSGSALFANFQLEIEPHLEAGRDHGFKNEF